MRSLILALLLRYLPASATHWMTALLTSFLQSCASHILIWLAVLMLALLFLGLAGVALMLGFLYGQFHWVLLGVPAGALLLLLGVWLRAHQISPLSPRQPRRAATDRAH
jgi:hypothetical protein